MPMLADAARNTASWAVRNMATVGGNVFTPPPGGDVAVALLALDARVILASVRGERALPLEEFLTGFMTTELAPNELLAGIAGPDHGRSDRLQEVRSQAREHAGGGDGRGPRALVRRPRGGRADRARRGRAAPVPGTADGTARRRVGARPEVIATAPRPRPTRPTLHRRHRHRVVSTPDGRGPSAARSSGWRRETGEARWRMTSKIVSFQLGDREVEVMVAPLTTLQSVLRNQLGATADQGGVPTGRLRQLHRPARRRACGLVPAARGGHGGPTGHHAGDPHACRGPASDPAGVHRPPRLPVRLLHLGDGDGHVRPPGARPRARRPTRSGTR